CTGWIVVQSSQVNSLPSGNRVSPSNVANMATVSTPNNTEVLHFNANSNHWRFIGLEITGSYISTINTQYNLVLMGYDNSTNELTVSSQLPNQIILDRVYIHGLPNGIYRRGIVMDTQASALVDSYCSEIHDSGTDSQCIGV